MPLSDVKLLGTIRPQFISVIASDLNYDWPDDWIGRIKPVDNRQPSGIASSAEAIPILILPSWRRYGQCWSRMTSRSPR